MHEEFLDSEDHVKIATIASIVVIVKAPHAHAVSCNSRTLLLKLSNYPLILKLKHLVLLCLLLIFSLQLLELLHSNKHVL